MEWRGRRGSGNIEDRRGMSVGRVGVGGVGVVAVVLIGMFFGVDLTPLLNDPGAVSTQDDTPLTDADRAAGEFVSVTLADTEAVWSDIFQDQVGEDYRERMCALRRLRTPLHGHEEMPALADPAEEESPGCV